MDYYELGKKGTYEDIIKHYGPFSDNFSILKGLNDRNDTDLLIKLYNKLVFSFYDICVIGIRPLIDYVLNNLPKKDYPSIDKGLWGACEGGHKDLIDLMIQKGATWVNFSFVKSFNDEHIDTIKYLIKYEDTDIIFDWNSGFSRACRYGNVDIAKIMLQKGASDYNQGLRQSCEHDHRDIVELIISHSSQKRITPNWNSGLITACRGGHMYLINKMVKLGAGRFDQGLLYACQGDHIDVVKLMISLGATNIDHGVIEARDNDSWDIVEYLIMLGGINIIQRSWINYYKYLASKLNKPRQQEYHGVYEVLNDLVALYT